MRTLLAERTLLRILSVLLLALVIFVPALGAQSITAGSVTGTALDDSGEPVTGALVALREVPTGLTWTQEVGTTGEFRFTFLAPGDYELFVEQIGYRPTRVVHIVVAPGAEVRVTVHLAAATPPVVAVDTVRHGGEPLGNGPGAEQAIRGFAMRRVPFEGLGIAGAAGLSSQLGAELGAEGLPTRETLIAVDGVLHDVARHPYLPGGDLLGIALPRGPLARLDVLAAPLDAEWTDFAGAVVNATTRPGSRNLAVQAFGDWSGGGLASSDFFDPGATDHGSWRGGAVIAGPIVPDTAFVILGVEAQRARRPMPPAWVAGPGDSVLAAATDSMGADLSTFLAPRLVSEDRIAGLARLDWQLAERHRASATAAFGFWERSEPAVGSLGVPSPGAVLKGTDVWAGAAVTSRLSETLAHELRVGFEQSERDYRGAALPATFLATGERFGTDAGLPARFQRTGLRLDDALHLGTGTYRLKLGLTGSFANYEQAFAFGRGPVFWFGDAAGFAAGRGVVLETVGSPPAASFSVARVGGLVQGSWTATPGLDLLTAVRYDIEFLPSKEIPLNQEWLARTGLTNQLIPRTVGGWTSRLGFVWRIGDASWLLRGGAGIYRDVSDPALLGELVTESGTTVVRRGVGALSGWPGVPSGGSTVDVGARIALLGPSYEPPRSTKISFGIARRLGTGGALSVAVNYRHTDFLIRRHDLNRLPAGAGQDQYGRPLYGSLVKEGGLVAADPASNRRFDAFELASAMDPDGFSDYRGMTIELEQPAGRFLGLRVSYTFSETTDNWLSGWGGGPYAQLSPFPDSLNGQDWAEGISDLDVPHRAAAGVELWPLGRRGVSLGVRYAVSSGRPFTPGFPAGVDANGDGSVTNDPAFVDSRLSGMNVMLGRWPCLTRQAGRFAERNSCREPAVEALDLRLGLGPKRWGGVSVEMWIEALNVTDEPFARRDHALYLVDPGTPLASDPLTGEVTVPLVVNQRFGSPVAYGAAGRFVRFGLRVGY